MGHNKSSFLKQAVEHIDITSFDARPIIDSMSKMSFVSRETANAAKIFNNMLKLYPVLIIYSQIKNIRKINTFL